MAIEKKVDRTLFLERVYWEPANNPKREGVFYEPLEGRSIYNSAIKNANADGVWEHYIGELCKIISLEFNSHPGNWNGMKQSISWSEFNGSGRPRTLSAQGKIILTPKFEE